MSQTFANSINSNPIFAARSTADADGNNIASTYATKSDLASYTPTASLATVATTGDYADLSGKPTIPGVDQTYNSASTNAQSGTAVAQAIASIPSASYTAGDGIDITSGEISVAYDQNTLDVAAISTTASISSVSAHMLNIALPSDAVSMISSLMTDGPSVTMTIPSDSLTFFRDFGFDAFLVFSTQSVTDVNNSIILKAPLAYSETEDGISLDGQTVTLPVVDSTNWYIGSNVTTSSQFISVAFHFGTEDGSSVSLDHDGFASETGTLDQPLTFTQLGAPLLTVLDPIPTHSSGDSGKVLTVNSSGNAAWATPSVVPTAGNMLSTTNNVLNVTTTAGITDIQQVNALPASPVSTVLYLIPET